MRDSVTATELAEKKARLILALRQRGILDRAVMQVMEETPRDLFVSPAFRHRAWEDNALPIDCKQTISQPLVVAMMTQALSLNRRLKVLEIGTGSGYQTAILSQLCRRVYTVERHKSLLTQAEERFARLRLTNITAKAGDGSLGWVEQAPFERILVTAAAADIPPVLGEQLSVGGIMVVPIGDEVDHQDLLKITKTKEGMDVEVLEAVRFVPLLPGVAEGEEDAL